jgi:hypothetical protein
MAGDTMVACCMASTGEALTFGGSGGYVHLWALSHQPRINSYSEVSSAASLWHCTCQHAMANQRGDSLTLLVPRAAAGGTSDNATACGAADRT